MVYADVKVTQKGAVGFNVTGDIHATSLFEGPTADNAVQVKEVVVEDEEGGQARTAGEHPDGLGMRKVHTKMLEEVQNVWASCLDTLADLTALLGPASCKDRLVDDLTESLELTAWQHW